MTLHYSHCLQWPRTGPGYGADAIRLCLVQVNLNELIGRQVDRACPRLAGEGGGEGPPGPW